MKPTFTAVFLDCDGVLSDFYSSAVEAMGMTKGDINKVIAPGPGAWNFHKTFMTSQQFWEKIDAVPNFWQSLPKLKQADDIVNLCENWFGDNVYILTSPPRNSNAYSGKAEWVMKYFPKYVPDRLLVGRCKHIVAKPGYVLIDDYQENCTKFEEAGGTSILVPARCNHLHYRENEAVGYISMRLMQLHDGY